MQIINYDIIKSPLNWFIVILMLIIFGFGLDMLMHKISD